MCYHSIADIFRNAHLQPSQLGEQDACSVEWLDMVLAIS